MRGFESSKEITTPSNSVTERTELLTGEKNEPAEQFGNDFSLTSVS
jgi:hypothetical protein